MVVWLYAGGGQAELGVVPWLQKIFSTVSFERRTPQIVKPGPRPNSSPLNKIQQPGLTGASLAEKIKKDLADRWGNDKPDVLILLDDTDCEVPAKRKGILATAVRGSIPEGEMPCLTVALAVPELEVWLLADWKNTFEKSHPKCSFDLKQSLKEAGVDFSKPETFDCYCNEPGNYRKISVLIQSAFDESCGPGPRYSKATDSNRLLQRANPNTVAENCPHFKTFWIELASCLK